jgi:hypothetical protein
MDRRKQAPPAEWITVIQCRLNNKTTFVFQNLLDWAISCL